MTDQRAELDAAVGAIRSDLGGAHRAREAALPACRTAIRHAGLAIRAVHRDRAGVYEAEVAACETAIRTAQAAVADFPAVAHAGFLHDAEKEFAEARLTRALVDGTTLPGPDALRVLGHSWLKGLCEAASELRRNVLDRLRRGDLAGGEALLGSMDDAYDVLASVDLPDALTGGLRRSVDTLRAVTERTRGDLTTTILQTRLQHAIESAATVTAGQPSSDQPST